MHAGIRAQNHDPGTIFSERLEQVSQLFKKSLTQHITVGIIVHGNDADATAHGRQQRLHRVLTAR